MKLIGTLTRRAFSTASFSSDGYDSTGAVWASGTSGLLQWSDGSSTCVALMENG
jgi:hypothetical protein